MILKPRFEEYTEDEFLYFIKCICDIKTDDESEHDSWVFHFSNIIQHPRRNGLIYYPEDGEDDSPEGILKTIKEWRASQGLPGFKEK